DGTTSMVGAGLFIHRKTRTIMSIVLSCAVLNIVLNLILVPRIGIIGAAIATLVCYVAAALSLAIAGRNFLVVAIPWRTLGRAGIVSVVMYLALIRLYPGHRFVTIGVRVALGAALYGSLMGIVDEDARALGLAVLARLRRGKGT